MGREVGQEEVEAPPLALAFDDFFAAQYRPLLALATALTGSRATGEDVVQEALYAASRSWAKVSGYDDPAQWARGVVMRRASNVRRGRFREVRALRRLGSRREERDDLPEIVGDGFWNAVRQLPRRQRECVALHYLEDRSTTDIAATLGIAEATVRVHLHGARMTLASTLKEEEEP
jgi:RNA polymerase sigma-70 factor (ECF subfamily)